MNAARIPFAGDEPTLLRAFLGHFRETLQRQCTGLDAAQVARRLEPSALTLGGLLSHLAFVEDHWFAVVLTGEEPAPEWRDVDWRADPDFEFHRARGRTPEELLAGHREACERSEALLDAALTRGGLDQLCARRRHGREVSLRWVLVHMVEEYARHCGHADLLRESIDGAVDL